MHNLNGEKFLYLSKNDRFFVFTYLTMKNRKNNKKSKILSPKALSTILANVNQTNEVIDQGFFRGIFNQNTQHEDACYCYAISFI